MQLFPLNDKINTIHLKNDIPSVLLVGRPPIFATSGTPSPGLHYQTLRGDSVTNSRRIRKGEVVKRSLQLLQNVSAARR